MAKTFRQEVEEIQNPIKSCNDKLCEKYKSVGFNGWANCVQCRTDRICKAAKRMGERMPKFQSDIEVVGKAVEVYRTRCQAHIMREIEDNG